MTVAYTDHFFGEEYPLDPAERDGPGTWHAFLRLQLEKRGNRSALTRVKHRGPLCVQKPFYPEGQDLAHLYILHPPGGIVSGDVLSVVAEIGQQTHALFTAPGAGRAYRARAAHMKQIQDVVVNVGAHGSAEWLPQENILYPGSRAAMHTRINLSAGSHFIGWDITSFGLPAQGDAFTSGEFTQKFSIWQLEKPLFAERFFVCDHNRHLMTSRAGLQGHAMQGLFVAGPFDVCEVTRNPVTDALLDQCRALSSDAQDNARKTQRKLLAGITHINGFLVGRCLAHCSEDIKKLFARYWATVRPALLNRPACAPRIWAT